MINPLQTVLDFGVHEDMPPYEQERLRFVNFMELFCQIFYLFYFIMGFVFGSAFLSIATLSMIAVGWVGLILNHFRFYNLARSLFITSFCFLLSFVCNTLDIGFYFLPFFFPALISFALYYDLERDLSNAVTNLTICLICALLALFLPPQILFADNIAPGWTVVVRNLNYSLGFGITLIFVFFTVFHIYKSGRQLIEAKEKAELAVQVKSRFLSSMSHEMRTPLNGIIGTVNLLLQDPPREEQRQYYEVLKYSSEHMLKVVNDVLDFSKIEAGKMDISQDSFNMSTLLSNIYTVFKKQFADKKIQFDFQIDPQMDQYFNGDETRIGQILNNLLSNAHKFTDAGRVECQVKMFAADSQTASIYFAVEDTGIGMDSIQLSHVFEAFNQGEISATRKFGGTGLGLTITERIVEKLGGHLFVESMPGKGSKFYFTLEIPFCGKNRKLVQETSVTKLHSLQGTKVLVAEDNPVNMTIAKKFMERWDVTVVEAVNGEEALSSLAANGPFDLVLLDLDMPVMDGYKALAEIRKKDMQIPVLAFTAAVLPNMKEALIAKGFNDMLQKPFKPEDLHKKIAAYVGQEK